MTRGISTNKNLASIASCLHGADIGFACRYSSYTTKHPQKRLTLAEAEKFVAAQLSIVAVYEDGPTEAAYFNFARGEQDARHAFAYKSYNSHSAVVVERGSGARGEYVITIGGNEGSTVGRKRVDLHPDGFIVQRASEPYICVIQSLK